MGFILMLCLFFLFVIVAFFFILKLYRTRDAGHIVSPLSSIEPVLTLVPGEPA